ncbi:MAG: MATE family efflux transporter [Proteocatella sp.]
MTHSISKEFKFGELLKFAFPSIIMMMLLSFYTIVDGFFVARFVGTDALSAISIVYPLISVIIAIGVIFATGGSALVATQMGEGLAQMARKNFTLIVISAVTASVIIAVASLVFIKPVVIFLGARGSLILLCEKYLIILLLFAPVSVLQMLFQSFFVTAGKPGLGLGFTVSAGLCNIILDYIFIVPMDMGIQGAALATGISYCLPAISGLIFFSRNKSGLGFSIPSMDFAVILKSCFNGSSEMITNISGSVIALIFNIFMMKFVGSDGVAAISVIMYCQFLMTSLFLGFSIGVSPIIGFHHGAQNKVYLKKLLKMCWGFIFVASILVFIVAIGSSKLISGLFSQENSAVYLLIRRGMFIFSFSFLFAGINIFSSAVFTALSDGKTSAAISFSRTFLFTILGIFIMTRLFAIDGLWLSIPFAEAVTALITVFILFARRKNLSFIGG